MNNMHDLEAPLVEGAGVVSNDTGMHVEMFTRMAIQRRVNEYIDTICIRYTAYFQRWTP